jgi:hypothetical protein
MPFPFGNLKLLALDFEPQAPKYCHVDICDPDQGEAGHQVPLPGIEQQLISGDPEQQRGYIVTEAVFACQNIKKLALVYPLGILTSHQAKIAYLPENLLMRQGPGHARDRNRKQKQS